MGLVAACAGAAGTGLAPHAGCKVATKIPASRAGRIGAAPRACSAAPARRRVAAAAAPALAPDLAALRGVSVPLSEAALARAVEGAFLDTFWGSLAAPRVLASYRRLLSGDEFRRDWPGQGLQVANSYMEGLSATPFPDMDAPGYSWLRAVEEQAPAILSEFLAVTADPDLSRKGNNIWVPAVRGDAAGYGDDWRTLVLQDRGRWDADNARLFPRTAAIFQQLNAPTLEVFFARQPPGTGIKTHTDYVNFIQTSHLGLLVPPGPECWFRVGQHVRQWEEGRACVWDTSFMHETWNGADAERVVLIMRHWHPEVTPLERVAVTFLFDCLDAPTLEGIRQTQARAQAQLGSTTHGGRAAKGKGKGRKGAAGGSKGFGAKGFGAAK